MSSEKRQKLTHKIKSASSLRRVLSQPIYQKKKIVLTNGCFDLIHKGHVTYLEKARNLGDLLVVALNSDDSVRRLKGLDRPLNSLEDRLEVMAALESVSFVTWFEDDTPIHVIRTLRPALLVKGGDWKIDQIVGSQEVISWGGKVKSLSYVAGQSTTQLIQKARANSS